MNERPKTDSIRIKTTSTPLTSRKHWILTTRIKATFYFTTHPWIGLLSAMGYSDINAKSERAVENKRRYIPNECEVKPLAII